MSSILPEWQSTTSTTSSLSWQLPELQLLRTAIQPFCAHSSRNCTRAIKPSSPAGPWLRCVGWVLISSLDNDSEGASHSRIIRSTFLSSTLQQNSSLEFGNFRCTQDVFPNTLSLRYTKLNLLLWKKALGNRSPTTYQSFVNPHPLPSSPLPIDAHMHKHLHKVKNYLNHPITHLF